MKGYAEITSTPTDMLTTDVEVVLQSADHSLLNFTRYQFRKKTDIKIILEGADSHETCLCYSNVLHKANE
jgi:hypothetical protein